MAYLEFEVLGVDRVKTKKSVAYIDHNTLQTEPENADDHLYIQTVVKKYGIYYSKSGNGICRQVHLERFAIPGQKLLGSDSHAPNLSDYCLTPCDRDFPKKARENKGGFIITR